MGGFVKRNRKKRILLREVERRSKETRDTQITRKNKNSNIIQQK